MTGRRAAAAAALLAASVAGCGVTHDGAARPISPIAGLAESTTTTTAPAPAPSTAATTTTTAAAPTTPGTTVPAENVAFYYVTGDRLRPEYRFLPVDTPGARIELARTLDELAAGPSFTTGLTNPFTRDMVEEARLDRGRAEVWLSPVFLALEPPAQLAVVAQLVLTLTDRPGIGRVVFRTAAEAEVAVLRPGGLAASGDTTSDDYDGLLEP